LGFPSSQSLRAGQFRDCLASAARGPGTLLETLEDAAKFISLMRAHGVRHDLVRRDAAGALLHQALHRGIGWVSRGGFSPYKCEHAVVDADQ
jgi:hypothetical protein